METEAQMKAMNGTQGHTDGMLLHNHFFTMDQWNEEIERFNGSARALKNIVKDARPAREVWTWVYGYSRFSMSYTLYKQDLRIEEMAHV